jgi:hypothetical protein
MIVMMIIGMMLHIAISILKGFKVCRRRRRPVRSVPIEFPRKCISVNPR